MRQLLFTAAMLSASAAGAQVLDRQVLAPGGTSFSGAVSIDWTIGETVVQSATVNNTRVLQGFHHPLTSASSAVVPLSSQGIRMYPNPASDRFFVQWEVPTDDFTVELYSVTGALLHKERVLSGMTAGIDISQFAPGSYLVQVSDARRRMYGTLVRI
jgi:hypothetical protein